MLSVVIPVHNSIQVIETNLNNILSKTTPDDEVIIVDDKSENSKEIHKLAFKYEVRYLYIEPETSYNRCLAINEGVENSKYSWIVELDQDKIPITREYFSNLKKHILANYDYKIVRFGHTQNHFPLEIKLKYIDHNGVAKFNAIVGGNVCYSKRFFNEVGGYDTAFDGNRGFQDFDLFYRMQSSGGKLLYLKEMLADHIDSHIKSNSMYKTNMERFFTKHGFYPEVD